MKKKYWNTETVQGDSIKTAWNGQLASIKKPAEN